MGWQSSSLSHSDRPGIDRTSGNVDTVSKIAAMFHRPEVQEFKQNIPSIGNDYPGIISKAPNMAGVWESNREPSFLISGSSHDRMQQMRWRPDSENLLLKDGGPCSFMENPEGQGHGTS